MLFTRFFPSITVWEVREGLHEVAQKAQPVLVGSPAKENA
jgi:hypothetical protein